MMFCGLDDLLKVDEIPAECVLEINAGIEESSTAEEEIVSVVAP